MQNIFFLSYIIYFEIFKSSMHNININSSDLQKL